VGEVVYVRYRLQKRVKRNGVQSGETEVIKQSHITTQEEWVMKMWENDPSKGRLREENLHGARGRGFGYLSYKSGKEVWSKKAITQPTRKEESYIGERGGRNSLTGQSRGSARGGNKKLGGGGNVEDDSATSDFSTPIARELPPVVLGMLVGKKRNKGIK